MIVVAGEALIDLVGEAGTSQETCYHPVTGGSPANVAVTLARLGTSVRLLARIGPDAFGRQVRAHLDANSVDLTWAVSATEPTSLAVASLDAHGRAEYDFYFAGAADWQWVPDELPGALAAPVAALHCGSLAMAMPPGATTLEQFVARTRAANAVTVSIDLNLRPSILGDRERESERVARQVRHAHIAKASDEDVAWLYPGVPVSEVAARWQAAGVACVMITLGADGAYLLMPDGSTHRQPGLAVPVIDTVGAGDAFTGGALAALASIGGLGADPLARLTSVTGAEWRWVMDHATTVAALTCTRRGADPPTLDETTQPIPRSTR